VTVFNAYARYYDLLYKDKDYTAEAQFISGLIREFAPESRKLLELGCGTGIHAQMLSAEGYQIHGVDFSQDMLDCAEQRLKSLPLEHAARLSFSCEDIRHFRQDAGFDVVLSLFHVVSYQTTQDDLLATFNTARNHLNSGGLFIFDCWYGPAVITDKPSVRVKRLQDERIAVTRIADPKLYPNDNRVDVNYQVFVKEKSTSKVEELNETHRMRYLFEPEVEALCSVSGFNLVGSGEWMSGKTPGFDTWGVYFIVEAE